MNAKGARCGGPAVPEMEYCSHHLSDLDRQRREDTTVELIRLGRKALERCETAMDTAPRWEDRLTACRLVMARVYPTSGPAQVQILLNAPAEATVSASDVIRDRLRMLRERTELAQSSTPGGFVADLTTAQPDDDGIVDAIIIPEPVAPQHIPVPRQPEPEPVTVRLPPRGSTWTTVPTFGVPGVSTRPADEAAVLESRSHPGTVSRYA